MGGGGTPPTGGGGGGGGQPPKNGGGGGGAPPVDAETDLASGSVGGGLLGGGGGGAPRLHLLGDLSRWEDPLATRSLPEEDGTSGTLPMKQEGMVTFVGNGGGGRVICVDITGGGIFVGGVTYAD